ncbi:MAG: glycine--tRNA ligase subunit beta [Acidobacteria bacterium RIFCSPLOWO2_12_FULL_65_11]|nr:MAG: glycine--tRNA ligase subunit beta [Acidobacteria bacterium RIFCSPLOWO2_02_FULL_64_15]OFW28510.1 MAG: glycine--tRNA ligase subunit beta [Acidobacteria bacterium RIFCSPLOWO2_12_FULL_65_11]
MERELLLEIGCEELPASWLPGLTNQLAEVVVAELQGYRLAPETPAETFSTPRRLALRIARVPERQTDLEELVNGPPVSAAFRPDGTSTPAATGFAAKQGVEVAALERLQTPKGEYLVYRKRQRGKASVDVLPQVLGGTLRALTFPKLMHWDAMIEDGRGELLFGRPIRWLLYLYGGRVVPFTISRAVAAQSGEVQDVTTGAVTYGHRFLATSGRAGHTIKVRSFDDYRNRLLENFVVLERSERHDRIASQLDAKAQRLAGRVSRAVHSDSGLLHEVPDLVEYPSVVAGSFAPEFLDLPDEVLTTTLVHHQHYFPVEGEDGKLKNAFLAVINTEPDNERTIARNAERVVTARLRDARFFWEADRKSSLESRIERLGTLVFHKKLGTYKEKAERIERLADWLAREAFGASAEIAALAARAARLSKADLTTDMVREFTELQGTMGGIYAREEGLPEEVWKAIYFHYLPIGVEANAPPARVDLGKAAVTWAAVSLADKLDTIVGLFAVGERPTGSRDPYGLRRAAHGVFRILVDLYELTGLRGRPSLGMLLDGAREQHGSRSDVAEFMPALRPFMLDRLRYVLDQRGFDVRNVRAVTHELTLKEIVPVDSRRKLEVLPEFTESADFQQLAVAFKRVRNIAKELPADRFEVLETTGPVLMWSEAAEKALADEIDRRKPAIESAVSSGDGYREAFKQAARFKPVVDKFFDDVLVMDKDPLVRERRLRLLRRLEALILKLADISEIVAEDSKSG